jgi:hypothetical protein
MVGAPRKSKRKAASDETEDTKSDEAAIETSETKLAEETKEEDTKKEEDGDKPPAVKKPRKDIAEPAAETAVGDGKTAEIKIVDARFVGGNEAGADEGKSKEDEAKDGEEENAKGANTKPAAKPKTARKPRIKKEQNHYLKAYDDEDDEEEGMDDATQIVEDPPEVWNKTLYDLLLYKNQYKTLHVQKSNNPALHEWAKMQRRIYRCNRKDPASVSVVSIERLRALDAIEFPFTTKGMAHWNRFYDRLKEYKEKHGKHHHRLL